MSAEPLDEIQWKSPEWIQQFGLHTGNVLDYFAESPFYDRTSNNQVLRMQFQFQQMPPNIHPQKYLQTRLAEMVGTEFVVAFVREPDFWVIRKQRRLDPQNTLTEHDYYIIGANVYQSPMVRDVLASRVLATVLSVKKSVSLLNKMASFSISEGGHTYASESAPVSGTGNKLGHASAGTGTSTITANGNNTSTNTIAAGGLVGTPTSASNPGTVAAHTTGGATADDSSAGAGTLVDSGAEILATAFDNLLASVVAGAGTEKSVYIDEIPLYGKGSTVEQLGLQLNLNLDDDSDSDSDGDEIDFGFEAPSGATTTTATAVNGNGNV